jgi:hypothetical protein
VDYIHWSWSRIGLFLHPWRWHRDSWDHMRWSRNRDGWCYVPDVDLEQQLMFELSALQEKNFTTEISHVKGHQDKESKSFLTTEEALNVEANELTHDAQKMPLIKEYGKLPTNKVNFKLNNRYINSHYQEMVNQAFHSMALRKCYAP